MKIIHVTASYKPAYIYGGPIQSVGKLCEVLTDDKRLALGTDGVNLQVLTTTANGKNELNIKTGKPILVDGVPIVYFKRWTKDHSHFSPRLLWVLRKEILRCTQDDNNVEMSKLQSPNSKLIIHIHAWWNLVSVLSCFIAKWYNIPVVLSPRGMLTSYTLGSRNAFFKNLIHKMIGKGLLKYCHIHATSVQEQTDILSIVTPKSIRVIPNLVNLPLEESSSKNQVISPKYQETGSLKLIFLSRIEEKKGLRLLFKALAIIDIPWQLTIAGLGEEKYIQSLKILAEELKINNRINWVGQISNQDKFTLIAEHDLLALTSYNENFANVVVESLSVGTPVLISEQVGLSDYVKNKKLGWVTTLETEEIKNGLISANQNTEKRQNIRTTAPVMVRADFSDDTLIKQYVEFYNTL